MNMIRPVILRNDVAVRPDLARVAAGVPDGRLVVPGEVGEPLKLSYERIWAVLADEVGNH
jgi:hypothetical protein